MEQILLSLFDKFNIQTCKYSNTYHVYFNKHRWRLPNFEPLICGAYGKAALKTDSVLLKESCSCKILKFCHWLFPSNYRYDMLS